MIKRLLIGVLSALLLAIFEVPTAVATAERDVPPIIGGGGQEGVTTHIATSLAKGNGESAGQMICDYGYVDRMSALGSVLSTADRYVVRAGADQARVNRFAKAVATAYERAVVPKDVAVGSFALGLSNIAEGYVGDPSNPVAFWPSQTLIGSEILSYVAASWATPPIFTAPCANNRSEKPTK